MKSDTQVPKITSVVGMPKLERCIYKVGGASLILPLLRQTWLKNGRQGYLPFVSACLLFKSLLVSIVHLVAAGCYIHGPRQRQSVSIGGQSEGKYVGICQTTVIIDPKTQ